MKRNVAAIVLAAGSSSRMGTAKQLLRLSGRTLLRCSAETALASMARVVVVVVGSQAALMRDELRDLEVSVVENPRWAEGMGTSISASVGWITAQADPFDAAVLMTCDQPHVVGATIDRLIVEQESSGKRLVASRYGGTVGVPALFTREYFASLCRLPPEQGAKHLLRGHEADMAVVDFEEGAIDLDTPADYERLARDSKATS